MVACPATGLIGSRDESRIWLLSPLRYASKLNTEPVVELAVEAVVLLIWDWWGEM